MQQKPKLKKCRHSHDSKISSFGCCPSRKVASANCIQEVTSQRCSSRRFRQAFCVTRTIKSEERFCSPPHEMGRCKTQSQECRGGYVKIRFFTGVCTWCLVPRACVVLV